MSREPEPDMPLSKPERRQHIHTRSIECRGFEREDGLWDIEGAMIDTKTYPFDNRDRDGVTAGEAIHHMIIRLTVDDDLVVRKAEASTESAPYTICGDVTGGFSELEGLKIGPGWRKAVTQAMGGVAGCTHLRDLLMGPVAVTAYQTIIPRMRAKAQQTPGAKPRPPMINSCHAYDSAGPVVARQWPEFFTGSNESAE